MMRWIEIEMQRYPSTILYASSSSHTSFQNVDDPQYAIFGSLGLKSCHNRAMKLTTRGHYSVKALLDLSLQPAYGPASVNAIATRQDLPAPYLEKLLIALRRAGLVTSVRGAQGGYQLAKPPAQISLGQVLAAVGETVEPLTHHAPSERQDAAPKDGQSQAEDWVTFAVWNRLHQKMRDALYGISLEDLYYDARSWQASQGTDPHFIV
jgi:Rrf2 family transcriptional regulator, iron-sulfur cluster assembly transcription factor